MPINPKTPGIHHINLRCKDMAVTKDFYQNIIGLPVALDTPEILGFVAGGVFVVFKKADANTRFNPFTIGMDHLAFACETEEELHRFAKGLANLNVENTGVKLDETLQKLYVAFKDPDRIQLEFYMM